MVSGWPMLERKAARALRREQRRERALQVAGRIWIILMLVCFFIAAIIILGE